MTFNFIQICNSTLFFPKILLEFLYELKINIRKILLYEYKFVSMLPLTTMMFLLMMMMMIATVAIADCASFVCCTTYTYTADVRKKGWKYKTGSCSSVYSLFGKNTHICTVHIHIRTNTHTHTRELVQRNTMFRFFTPLDSVKFSGGPFFISKELWYLQVLYA